MPGTIASALKRAYRRVAGGRETAPAEVEPTPGSLVTAISLTDLLVGLLEYHDPFFRGGSSLTGLVAIEAGRGMGLPGDELEELALAALLRDLGRLAMGGRLLKRTRAELEQEEKLLIRRHVGFGLDLLEGVDLPGGVRGAIRHHHERWDGAGYPDGLAGEAIPRMARILAVADSFCAMIRPRPYRPPLRLDAALAEMREHSGTAYDPAVVVALMRVMNRSERHVFGRSPGHHVLVVHRDGLRAIAISTWLCQHGFLAEVAPDAERALERIRRVPVVALVVDSEADGWDIADLIRGVRDCEQRSGVCIVAFDASAPGTAARAVAAGADACLPQEVGLRTLRETLSRLVNDGRPGWTEISAEALGEAEAPAHALAGSLIDFPLPWLLQALKYDIRTAAIVVRTDGDLGRIFVETGDPRHAETRGAVGEDALRAMLRWGEGEFSVNLNATTTRRSIRTSLMNLLLDDAVDLDHQDVFGSVDPA